VLRNAGAAPGVSSTLHRLTPPGVVWQPFGQAGGVTTTPPTLVPHCPELIIPVVCPSGEDMFLVLIPRRSSAGRLFHAVAVAGHAYA
jgi:hypothetical protein